MRRNAGGNANAKNQGGADKNNQGQYMLGKTKKFYLERYAGIIDYLLSIDAHDCSEIKNVGRSMDYTACVRILYMKYNFCNRSMRWLKKDY